jgi:HSP20 family protein
MDIKNFEPTRAIQNLKSEFDSLVDRFLDKPISAITGAASPSLDLSETDTEIHLSMELPGMEEKDVDLSISGDVLTIRGQKSHSREEKGKTWHITERSSGSFSRSIRLPASVRAEQTEATFRRGVLQVILPKKEPLQTRKIEVKTEQE